MPLNNFNYLVSWSDFTQVPAKPPNINEDAEIHLAFPQSFDYSMGRSGAAITNVTVDIQVASPECWVLSSQTSNADLLMHEQGHYDITALGAREFYDGLVGLSAANENALNVRIRRLRNSVQQKINRTNINYDRQTHHGSNADMQQTWNQRIEVAKRNPQATINDLS